MTVKLKTMEEYNIKLLTIKHIFFIYFLNKILTNNLHDQQTQYIWDSVFISCSLYALLSGVKNYEANQCFVAGNNKADFFKANRFQKSDQRNY